MMTSEQRTSIADPAASGPELSDPTGVCVWLTGLSGSGKSTTAEALRRLLEDSGRTVTVLDGDEVRRLLSPSLGFERADRDAHIRRVGFMAAEIVRHGGTVICAVISPYRSTREEVRSMVGPARFVEVFVDTPLETCEARDPKGLYARSRQGELSGFTGVDDPYEPPLVPELVLDTVSSSATGNARRIIDFIESKGLLTADDSPVRSPARAAGRGPVPVADDPSGLAASVETGLGAAPNDALTRPDRRWVGSRPAPIRVLRPVQRPSLVPDLAPTQVFLVRHGTTLLNRQQRYRGRLDVPLDQGGWQDAWKAAAELAGVPIAAIYSSPLRRARDTARVISDATGVGMVVDLPGLVNLDYGDWEGLTPDEAAAEDADSFARYQEFTDDAACPGGERLFVAAERTIMSLRMLNLLHPGGNVVAVSHAVNVRLAIAIVTDGPRTGWRRNLPNGSITRFEVTPQAIALRTALPAPVGHD